MSSEGILACEMFRTKCWRRFLLVGRDRAPLPRAKAWTDALLRWYNRVLHGCKARYGRLDVGRSGHDIYNTDDWTHEAHDTSSVR